MPFALAQEDILFLHHVLEICYYFMPIKSYNPTIFSLLHVLYMSDGWLHTMAVKKFFLLKLFVLLGFTQDKKFRTPSFHRLVTAPFAQMLSGDIDSYDEETVNEWLRLCVASHPIADKFKTTYFLDSCREI